LHSLGEVESAQSNYPAHEALLEEALSIYRRLDDPSGMCSVLGSLGTILRYQGEFQRAADLYEEAIRLGRAVGDHVRVADLLARWGTLETERGKPTLSFARFDEANAMYYKLGNAHGEADIQLRTGETLASMGRYAEAMALYETCIEIFRTLGSTYAVAYTEIFQAEAALGINDPARASALAGQARDFFHTIGDRRSAGEALFHLAAAAAADRRGEASGLYQESLAIHHAIKTRPQVARCLERLAILAAEGGEMGRAARLHGGARTLRLEMGAAMMPADYDRYNRALERVRELMGDEEFTAAVAQGEQMTCDEVVALALNGHSAVRV
jgi:tetratricopeptide (TPR) repeat protein